MRCGGHGHLESYVSGKAADELAREAFGPAADAHRLVRLADEGDATAIEIVTEIGRKLGSGIASLINTFDPELVVIGGGFAAAGELLLAPAREVVDREVLKPMRSAARIVSAELGTAGGHDRRGDGRLRGLRRRLGLMPLAVCATPIGNLEDVTLRVCCASSPRPSSSSARTRGGRGSCSSVTGSPHAWQATTSTTRRGGPPRCCRGSSPAQRVALVSDAGLPGVSDPGARLIAAAIEAGVPVTVLPGASAVETALVASGFAAERYQFVGYLPRGAAALAALWEELRRWPWPAVAFESPRRLPATLRSLADALPERPVAVCRELTKQFEEVARGTAVEIAARFAEPPRGEITLVLGGSPLETADEGDGGRRRRRARRGGRPAPAGGGHRLPADRHPAQRPVPALSVTKV